MANERWHSMPRGCEQAAGSKSEPPVYGSRPQLLQHSRPACYQKHEVRSNPPTLTAEPQSFQLS